jgi:hypothetical protein
MKQNKACVRDIAGKINPLGCTAAGAMNMGLSEEEHIMLTACQ